MSNRVFGLVWAVLIGIFSLLPLWRGGAARLAPAFAAVALALIATLAPRLLAGPNRAWAYIGKKMHGVTSAVALFLLYFLLLTPGALLLRLCGRKKLDLKFDPKAKSYWTECGSGDTNFRHPY